MRRLRNFDTIDDAKLETLYSPSVVVVNDNGRKRVIYKRVPSARDEELLVGGGNTLNDVFVSIPYNKIIYTTIDGEVTITQNSTGLTWLTSIGYTNGKHGNHCEMIFDDDLTEIGNNAFYSCSGLKSIEIPESVTSIGNYAFQNCSGLTSITIPNGVTNIGDFAFFWCSGLTSITIPNSVTSIAGWFYGCTSLTSITIPNSVTSIGGYAFYYCSGLTSVPIPNSVTNIEISAFGYCSSLTSVTIPNSVTSIGYGVFSWCTGLTSVTIGNSVTSIGDSAFRGCSDLTSITCLATDPPDLGSNNDLPNVQNVYVPAGSVNAYKSKTNWSYYGDKIVAAP